MGRMNKCRPGYEVIFLDNENTFLIMFKDGTFLQEHEISASLIESYKRSLQTKILH